MNVEIKQLKDVLKFQLEFMILMLNSGRTDDANNMKDRLLATMEQAEGEYKA